MGSFLIVARVRTFVIGNASWCLGLDLIVLMCAGVVFQLF